MEPNYRVSSAVHITNCLQEHYVRAKTRLINPYASRARAYCSDDRHLHKCGNTVIHNSDHATWFIQLGAQSKTCLLQTTSFPENHTADNICEKQVDVLPSKNQTLCVS